MKSFINSLIGIVFLMASCEKFPLDSSSYEKDANILVNTSGISHEQATRSIKPLSELCTKISYVFYQDGERAKVVNQDAEDNGFGSMAVKLLPGKYTMLVVGHSGESNATTTDMNKIQFSGKVTDTFVYCEEIDVGETPRTVEAEAVRNVAMFRLNITGGIPDNVKRLKFYYTGGSSSFDAATRLGCVQSRQTEYRIVNTSQTTYDVYTFPHSEDGDMLKMTITALDDADNVVMERELTDVKVKVGVITISTMNFFDGASEGTSQEVNINIGADNEWKDSILLADRMHQEYD